jgi:methylated-DNA-[protein]-cysteine S-methyltransferase
MIYTCEIETPLGDMTAMAEEESLTGLWFIEERYYPTKAFEWINEPSYPVFNYLKDWLSVYFSGQRVDSYSQLQLDQRGTPFQKMVWDILLDIPYGEVTTYGEIAKKIARMRGIPTMSAQAIGGAVGRNPISILIPCHRVIGSNHKLVGYAGGLDKKAALLRLEGIDP